MKYLIVLTGFLFANPISAQICSDFIEQNAFSARYEVDVNTDASVVVDLATGLRWQRCSVGLVFNDNNGSADISTHTCDEPAENSDTDTDNNIQLSWDWNEAIERAHQEGSGWRLPNIKELSSLVELGCSAPAINAEAFPNTSQANGYWTSTPNATTDSSSWSVEFVNGSNAATDKRTALPIRLVNDQ